MICPCVQAMIIRAGRDGDKALPAAPIRFSKNTLLYLEWPALAIETRMTSTVTSAKPYKYASIFFLDVQTLYSSPKCVHNSGSCAIHNLDQSAIVRSQRTHV